MVIGVHLDVRRADVSFVAAFLFREREKKKRDDETSDARNRGIENPTTYVNAMVMRLLSVVLTVLVLFAAVVHRRISEKSVLKTFVSLFVPFKMSDHFFLFDEDSRTAIEAMKMLSEI